MIVHLTPERVVLALLALAFVGHLILHGAQHLNTTQQSDVVEIYSIIEASKRGDVAALEEKRQCIDRAYSTYRMSLLTECAALQLLTPACSTLVDTHQDGDPVGSDLEACLCRLPKEFIDARTAEFNTHTNACSAPTESATPAAP